MNINKNIVLIALISSYLQANTILEPIVVTATKTQNNIKNISTSIEVITEKDILQKGFTNVSDILNFTTGTYFVESSAISIRGFNSDHTLILLDGKRITGGFGAKYELNRIDISHIKQIEILRGSASALYGADALGGVINIITKKNTKESYTKIDSLYGVYSGNKGAKKSISLSSNLNITDKFNALIYGTISKYDKLLDKNNESLQRDGEVKTGGINLNYKISDHDDISINIEKMTDKGDNFSNKGFIIKTDDNKRENYGLVWNKKNDDYTFISTLYTSIYKKNNETFNLKKNKLSTFIKSKKQDIIFENQLSFFINDEHLITSGAEIKSQSYEGTAIKTDNIISSGTYKNIPYQVSKSKINYYGIYLQDEWLINDKLSMIPSIRYDDSDKFEDDLSPKLGLIYSISDSLRTKLNYSHGFKSPNPGDLYKKVTSTSKKSIFIGNQDLKSEKSNTYDISIEKETKDIKSKISLFYSDVDDLIEKVYTGNKDTKTSYKIYTYENLSKATIKGLELSFKYNISNSLDFDFDYTYLDAKGKILDGEVYTTIKLENRPKEILNAKLSYKYAPWNTHFNLWGKHIRGLLLNYERDKNNNIIGENNKNYSIFYTSIVKKINDDVDIYLGIDNILNKKDDEIPLTGLFSYIGVRYTF